ncbi:type II toxin-antitoxin system RelE/ParE family toxin [uncultured Tessaracoccus sp.]|uniref:type II toxin-antitoxin system RelE family toxin n=1 Tax=uncultured Tessaracoccus sp. TaxID=905023 RepID=UPI0026284185|nr:type II toxin-antitoxin system RelE/ParE family toxin [uncultured Tessaracoccus sp.]
MTWSIDFTEKAAKTFRKLDKPIQRRIVSYLREVAQDDPRNRGKALTADFAGLWRWRVGNWRIIAHIDDSSVLILVVDVDHRSRVYDR